MKERNPTSIFSTPWILVYLLHSRFALSFGTVTFLSETKGNISSRSYPQNYPENYYHEWKITAPRGHNIRLEFKDFDVGDCTYSGDILEVQSDRGLLELCGQRLPNLIVSKWNYMDLHIDSKFGSTGGRFWAYYEMFRKEQIVTTSKPSFFTQLYTGDGSSRDPEISSAQRIFFLLSIFGCVLILVIVTIYCGYYRKRAQSRQSPTRSANHNSSACPENENGFLELNFGDLPPSYDEVIGHTNPVGSNVTTQTTPGENTAVENEGIDSSGLPSYTEALRLSEQSLNANV